MTENVSSAFSITSKTLDADYLSRLFPWPVTEVRKPDDTIDYTITVFDLELGQHTRVDHHLTAAKQSLLKKETDLIVLSYDCNYALWVYYHFPNGQGAFNLSESLLAAFGFLRVGVVFHLKEL